MHMDMVDDFASMLRWLMTALPLIHKILSVLLPRQKQCHFQFRTSRSRVTSPQVWHLQLIVQRVSKFLSSASVLHLPVGLVKLWRTGSCLTSHAQCRSSCTCLQTP